ncbi:hypothetical protein U1Q18_009763 [Sarracenia purpurea var. burkii]
MMALWWESKTLQKKPTLIGHLRKRRGFGSCSEEGQTSSGTEESGEEEVDEGDSETAKTEAPLLFGNEEILETKQGPKILSLQVHRRY